MLARFQLILLLGAAYLGFIGVSRLSYNVEILDLLPKDMAGSQGTRLLRDTFERANQLIVTLDAPTSEIAEAAVLSLEEELKKREDIIKRVMVRPTWEEDGAQVAKLAAYGWLNARPEQLRKLIEKISSPTLKADLEERIAEMASSLDGEALVLGGYDPLGFLDAVKSGLDPRDYRGGSSEFSSKDGKFRIALVDPAEAPQGYRPTHVWIQKVKNEIVEPWKARHPEFAAVATGFTGSPVFRAEISLGMEEDMSQSIGGITLIVAILFWLLHRTIRPLFILLFSMAMAGFITLGIAGLCYGSLNVMSMGFAAVLMGMIEDFGVVGLHEWLENPKATFREVHKRVFPGIFWSAVTSSCVFASLSLSVLPGIAQLGILTAIGILVGAVVMLYVFLPLAMRWSKGSHDAPRDLTKVTRARSWPGYATVVLFVLAVGILTWRGLPKTISDSSVMHPTKCQAMDAMMRIQERMQPPELEGEWLPLFFHGPDEAAVNRSMVAANQRLGAAKEAGEVKSFFVPEAIFPQPQFQEENRETIARLAGLKGKVLGEMEAAGFADEGLMLSRSTFEVWEEWAATPPVLPQWPTKEMVEGSLGRLIQHKSHGPSASGYLRLPPGQKPGDSALVTEIESTPGIYPGGWRYLNEKMRPLIGEEIRRVCLPAVIILVVLLVIVFRNFREMFLVVCSLLFSGLILVASMSALGIQWNIVNIGAVPLTLGIGLDFNIHMMFALRRGSSEAQSHGIGRALAYCGLSTSLGFGSLAMAGNKGLISFGQCAMIGVGATLFTAAFVLPWLYHLGRKKAVPAPVS